MKVAWHDAYDPHLHRFVDVGRTLRLLKTSYGASFLTKRFAEVDELDLSIFIPQVYVVNFLGINKTLQEFFFS